MGITFTTYCKRCGVEAPEMGDFGYVGAPTLGPSKKKGGPTPFGVIFDGFAALGMVTAELAAFEAFLQEHRGHPIEQPGDGDEEDFGDDEEARAPSKRRKAFRFTGRTVDAFYELGCTKCEEAFRTASSERIVPFDEFAPDAAAIERFRKNAAGAGSDDLYRVGGFPYDDVEAVGEFLKAHRAHPLRVRLERGAPARRRGKTDASASWTPPEWRIEDHEEYLGPVKPETRLVLAGLNHHDPARRVAACEALRAAAEPGSLGFLVARADDPVDEVRAAVAAAIGALDDPRAVRPLGRLLLDHAEAVRAAARRALAPRGATEEEAVAQARSLRGPYPVWSSEEGKVKATREGVESEILDPERGSFAANAVLERNEKEPWAKELRLVLAVHPSSPTRSDAAQALAASDDPRARAALLALLEDVHPGPAGRAAEALGKRKERAAVPLLVAALARGERPLVERAGAALAEIRDPAAFDPLVHALSSPSPDIAKAAAHAVAALKDARAVASLAALLESERGDVRGAAAEALGAIGGAEAASALGVLAKSAIEEDRRRAAWGLGEIVPEPAAVHALEALLQDRDGWVRETATHVLARAQDDPRVHAVLAGSAERGNGKVAGSAWRVLIREGTAAAEKELVRAINLESPPEMVRDYLSSGNAALRDAARKAFRGRKLPAKDSGLRWGEGAPR